MHIRHAQSDDAPAMARVIVDTFLAAHRDHMPEEAWRKRKAEWTYEVSEQGWRRTLEGIATDPASRDCIYVAVDERDGANEVVGLVMGGPTESDPQIGEVPALYVLESHQGKGIGRRLVQAVAAYLAQRDISTLHIGVLAANRPARAFYEAIGGRVVGERDFDEEGVMLPETVYGWTDLYALIHLP